MRYLVLPILVEKKAIVPKLRNFEFRLKNGQLGNSTPKNRFCTYTCISISIDYQFVHPNKRILLVSQTEQILD